MIYLYHIRKTGGRSLIYALLSLCGNPHQLYQYLATDPQHVIEKNHTVFIGWNKQAIEKRTFFFAFSHSASHEIIVPNDVFTITILRDPLQRILSHYRMLISFIENKINHPCLKKEKEWLGDNFIDFLMKIPKEHLMRQLYMFSKKYNVEEAYEKIRALSHSFILENFTLGINELSTKLNMKLPIFHINKSSDNESVSSSYLIDEVYNNKMAVERAYEILEPEYSLYDKFVKEKAII